MVIRTNFFVGGNWKNKKTTASALTGAYKSARSVVMRANQKPTKLGMRRMKRLRIAHTRQSHKSHPVTISTKPANLYFNIQHQIETKQEKEKKKRTRSLISLVDVKTVAASPATATEQRERATARTKPFFWD